MINKNVGTQTKRLPAIIIIRSKLRKSTDSDFENLWQT